MNSKKNVTFAIVGKSQVQITSIDDTIDFLTSNIRLEIFVDDREEPKYIHLCRNLIDKDQSNTKIIRFSTNNENVFIVAYSNGDKIDLKALKVEGI